MRDAIATVYELSVPGRAGIDLPASDVPPTDLPADEVRADCGLPELSQLDVVTSAWIRAFIRSALAR